MSPLRDPEATRIALEPAWLRVASPGITWQRLQELHLRALGDSSYGYTSTAKSLTPDAAFALYSTTLAAVLGHIAVTDGVSTTRILSSLNDFAATVRSLRGIESPFLSAFAASFSTSGSTPATAGAAERWRSLGAPRELGGGALQTPILSAGGVLALIGADDLARAVRDASTPGLLNDGLASLFSSGADNAGSTDDAALAQIGETVLQVALGIAAAAEIQTRVKVAPPDHPGVLFAPDPVFDSVANVLRQTTYAGKPLLKSEVSRQFALVAQGKAIVVELGVLGSHAAHQPEAGRPGAPLAIAPTLPAATGTVGPSGFWRNPAVDPVPAMTAVGPGVARSLVPRPTGLALSALPHLAADGLVVPRGLLAAILDPPQASPGGAAPDAGRAPRALVPTLEPLQTSTPVQVIIDDVGVGHRDLLIDAGTIQQLVTDAVAAEVGRVTRTIAADVARARTGGTG